MITKDPPDFARRRSITALLAFISVTPAWYRITFDSDVFTDWFGLLHESTLPAHFDADYLRIWRAPGTDQ